MTSTQLFAESVDPYSWRNFPPGAVYAPYGWGPDFSIGMPMRYTHHIGYETTPKPNPAGSRRIGTYYDVVGRPAYGYMPRRRRSTKGGVGFGGYESDYRGMFAPGAWLDTASTQQKA